jgi:alkylation response protein AidB-like acyl-CoA dehydrogenase
MTDKSLSFMRSLCAGEIEQDVLFPYPEMEADEREILSTVIDSIDSLLGERGEDFRAWDAAGEMPAEFVDELRQFGLFGLIVPEEHGGMGLSNMAYSRTLQQVSRHDGSVAVTVGAHSSIGMRGLKLFGTAEQQARYYARLASGEMIAAGAGRSRRRGAGAADLHRQAAARRRAHRRGAGGSEAQVTDDRACTDASGFR